MKPNPEDPPPPDTDDEPTLRPGGRGRRPARRWGIAAIALAIVAAGIGSGAYLANQDQQPQPPTGASPLPTMYMPFPTTPARPKNTRTPTTHRTADATIPNSSITHVAATLANQWGITFKQEGSAGLVSHFTMPDTGRKWAIAVGHAAGDTSDRIGGIRCAIYNPDDKVTRTIVKHVEQCLAPVLRGPDRTAVPTWLEANAINIPVGIHRDRHFDNVYVEITEIKGKAFDVMLFPKDDHHPMANAGQWTNPSPSITAS